VGLIESSRFSATASRTWLSRISLTTRTRLDQKVFRQGRVEIIGDEAGRTTDPTGTQQCLAGFEIVPAGMAMRHHVEHRLAVPGDDDGLTAFDACGEFRQARCRLLQRDRGHGVRLERVASEEKEADHRA